MRPLFLVAVDLSAVLGDKASVAPVTAKGEDAGDSSTETAVAEAAAAEAPARKARGSFREAWGQLIEALKEGGYFDQEQDTGSISKARP